MNLDSLSEYDRSAMRCIAAAAALWYDQEPFHFEYLSDGTMIGGGAQRKAVDRLLAALEMPPRVWKVPYPA